jgi:endonuclease/exonuclease/phosphatase family metal-dependent hydrolase
MPIRIRSSACVAIAGAILCAALSTSAYGGTLPVTVLTYNTDHGGRLDGTTGQLNTIAAQNPDVVVLQEAGASQLSTYVNGLNMRFGTTAWHGVAAKHCNAGAAPVCTTYVDESVMILTRLATVSTQSRLIWAKDDYHVARATIQMTIALADGTPINVFVCHLPAKADAASSRLTYINTFQSWAQSFASPRLVGGDFNDTPSTTSIGVMKSTYLDAWSIVGSGSGYTHSSNGVSLTSRIDYWFSDLEGAAAISAEHTAGSLADSDHISLTALYNVPSAPAAVPSTPTETTLLDDHFSTFNAAYWPYGVFTGSQDSTIALTVNGGFSIGPLKAGTTGSHYNGMSTASYDLTQSGSMAARLAQAPNTGSLAYAMFAAGSDSNNFYRWYESGGALVAEKKTAGTKKTLVNLPYDAAAHQFLRIRRETNSATGTIDVVFETAPNNGGTPGTYVVRYREAWTASIVVSAMKCELKAGTSDATVAPGAATWDDVHVATK